MHTNAHNIAAQLDALARPHMTDYQTDLAHDRRLITARPGCPFLHWTRATGTGITMLIPGDDPSWPAPGEKVRYLFGKVSREHILREQAGMAFYWADWQTTEILLLTYFDGTRLRKIDHRRAMHIAKQWRAAVERVWAKPTEAMINNWVEALTA